MASPGMSKSTPSAGSEVRSRVRCRLGALLEQPWQTSWRAKHCSIGSLRVGLGASPFVHIPLGAGSRSPTASCYPSGKPCWFSKPVMRTCLTGASPQGCDAECGAQAPRSLGRTSAFEWC